MVLEDGIRVNQLRSFSLGYPGVGLGRAPRKPMRLLRRYTSYQYEAAYKQRVRPDLGPYAHKR